MPEGWDQSTFDRTIEEYSIYSKRTHQEIVNTKAYYVARKAIWFTPKADNYRMKQQLGGIVTVNRLNRKGKSVKRKELQLVKSKQVNAPLAALIINARQRKHVVAGLYGSKMTTAIREMLGNRFRSVAFLKSCWLPAVKTLAPLVKDKSSSAPSDSSAKQYKRAKGEAKPARAEKNPTALIVNLATARRDEKGALLKFGGPALQQALADEEASMRDYIERKIKPDADRFNAQQKT